MLNLYYDDKLVEKELRERLDYINNKYDELNKIKNELKKEIFQLNNNKKSFIYTLKKIYFKIRRK